MFHLAEITTGTVIWTASVCSNGWAATMGAEILSCLANYCLVLFTRWFEVAYWWEDGDRYSQIIGTPQTYVLVFHLANVTTFRAIAGCDSDSGFTLGAGVAKFKFVLHILDSIKMA